MMQCMWKLSWMLSVKFIINHTKIQWELTWKEQVWPVTFFTTILHAPLAGPTELSQSFASHSQTASRCMRTPANSWIWRAISLKTVPTTDSSSPKLMSILLIIVFHRDKQVNKVHRPNFKWEALIWKLHTWKKAQDHIIAVHVGCKGTYGHGLILQSRCEHEVLILQGQCSQIAICYVKCRTSQDERSYCPYLDLDTWRIHQMYWAVELEFAGTSSE